MLKIENLLEPFGLNFAKKQDLLTMLLEMKRLEISCEDLRRYLMDFVETQKVSAKKLELHQKKVDKRLLHTALRCSECSAVMNLLPVNQSPSDQTGDDSQSVWICSNMKCLETIYNKQSVKEILQERR